jgi:hypothetical protein
MINYEGDVRQLAALGFDSVKLDGCGHQKNMSLYATLMNQTGKTFETENCPYTLYTLPTNTVYTHSSSPRSLGDLLGRRR